MPLKTKLLLIAALGAITGMTLHMARAGAVELPDPMLDEQPRENKTKESITLAGGCFWGMQLVFEHVKGVMKAVEGYAGGLGKTAHYEMVSTGTTGHAESVQIAYNPTQITLGDILQIYFSVAHDPTQLNRQGPDHGTQYRSAIFFATQQQERIAEAYIEQLDKAKVFPARIVTKLEPLETFYPAEPYHQDYATRHPDDAYILANDAPKLKHLQDQFPDLYTP